MKRILQLLILILMLRQPQLFCEYLKIADFDRGEKPNLISGDYGSWNRTERDRTQFCNEDLTTDPQIVYGGRGCSLSLYYDVDSPNPPVYNGFWMRLERIDLTVWKYLSFYVKGDEEHGYTSAFEVQIKNIQGKLASFNIEGVTSKWQQIIIPLNKMNEEADFSEAYEMVIVFDERDATRKEGRIFLDEFCLYR
ncbi:MAG: hypothetical protein P9L98_04635 [Candidatus Kaelpia imicola]|nr:hypothetical protein [Candidatus Kaelpia imicola]